MTNGPDPLTKPKPDTIEPQSPPEQPVQPTPLEDPAGQPVDVAATGAAVVASGNPGCLLQLRGGLADRGLGVRVHHPVELLAWSVEGGGPPAE